MYQREQLIEDSSNMTYTVVLVSSFITLSHKFTHILTPTYCVARFAHFKLDIKKRVSFANGYLNFDFTNVLFSDEYCIYVGKNN